MKILAMDTSGQTASAAIADEYITRGELTIDAQKKLTHSEILLPMIDTLFRLSGLTIEDMDCIACVNGPGSFTGLRIGAATALGLARPAGKPLLPVPALDALAYNVGYAAAEGCLAVPMMDARRSQVYTAFYRLDSGKPERITDYMALPVEGALAKLKEISPAGRVIFIGDGASAYADTLRAAPFAHTFAPRNANRQRAASAALCAMETLGENGKPPGSLPPASELPLLYIRKPQAERARLGESS